jgi:hypothetical protein
MMDTIAAATSVAELAWYRTHVARAFAGHARRRDLERMIDDIARIIRLRS